MTGQRWETSTHARSLSFFGASSIERLPPNAGFEDSGSVQKIKLAEWYKIKIFQLKEVVMER